MSDTYLIVSEAQQVPTSDPQAIAEGLGLSLLGFLGPLLVDGPRVAGQLEPR
jgi:hypothetical protein